MEDTAEEDHHWLMVRGTCSVCSSTISSDFRTVDERNREEVNKYFNTNIENGTICMTCFNECYKSTRDTNNEIDLSFPFCYGDSLPKGLDVSDYSDTFSHPARLSFQNPPSASPVLGKREGENHSAVVKSPLKKQKTSNQSETKHRESTEEEDDEEEEFDEEEDLSLSPDEDENKSGTTTDLSFITNPFDLSFLSTLKVAELQAQLKKRRASTKGSKAQLVQRLVRYICLFNNNSHFGAAATSSSPTPSSETNSTPVLTSAGVRQTPTTQ